MTELKSRVAFVTGGSRGLGAAIARRLAQAGADVAITYVQSAMRAEAVVAEIEALGRRALALRADSADAEEIVEAVHAAARHFGRLDILVNNAGIFPYGPPDEVDVETLDRTLAIHVRGVFLASQAALAHMGEDGRIVSIGSSLGTQVPAPGTTLYSMSKSALTGFTKGLARDLGPRGITVNLVSPGSTDTDMNPADGEGAEEQRAITPLGRFGTPDDVAMAVAFLAGPGGRQITGATLAVDGGVTA
jgi:Dehydrogenases with different specificities (related to short-chain alcohol dehydrogenases)